MGPSADRGTLRAPWFCHRPVPIPRQPQSGTGGGRPGHVRLARASDTRPLQTREGHPAAAAAVVAAAVAGAVGPSGCARVVDGGARQATAGARSGWGTPRAALRAAGAAREVEAGADSDDVRVAQTDDGRGRCLVARCGVPAGGTVVTEHPLMVCRRGASSKALARQLQRLRPRHRRAFLDLAAEAWNRRAIAGSDGDGTEEQVARIVRTNGVGIPEDRISVCRLVSRANHSCHPNAMLRPELSGAVRIVATRPIAEREEVLVSYLSGEDLLRPTAFRRERLRRGPWRFACRCRRCEAPDRARGMRCPACGGGPLLPPPPPPPVPAADVAATAAAAAASQVPPGAWASCPSCGVPAPSAGELEEAEGVWEYRLLKTQREGPGARGASQAAVALHAELLSGRGPLPCPSPTCHWIGAEAAWTAMEAHLSSGRFLAASSAARQLAAFVQYVRGDALTPIRAEARAVRATSAIKAGMRWEAAGHHSRASRAKAVGRAHCELALAEASQLLGNSHEMVRWISSLRSRY
uniref:SET domain-containing protein n=1 Tax=Alexandrium monilatum TaxID=311494 RepID=A0A7S4T4C2_9DINO